MLWGSKSRGLPTGHIARPFASPHRPQVSAAWGPTPGVMRGPDEIMSNPSQQLSLRLLRICGPSGPSIWAAPAPDPYQKHISWLPGNHGVGARGGHRLGHSRFLHVSHALCVPGSLHSPPVIHGCASHWCPCSGTPLRRATLRDSCVPA